MLGCTRRLLTISCFQNNYYICIQQAKGLISVILSAIWSYDANINVVRMVVGKKLNLISHFDSKPNFHFMK